MKETIRRCAAKLKAGAAWLDARPVRQTVVIAFVVTLVVEMLSRRSFVKGLVFLATRPHFFLLCMLIVMLTLSISLLFKRRHFVLLFVCIIWLALGVSNFVLQGFRTTPLGAIDFILLFSTFTVVSSYVSIFELILIGICISVVIMFLVIAFRKMIKTKVRFVRALITLGVTGALIAGGVMIAGSSQTVQDGFANLGGAYRQFGFPYCFAVGTFDRGVDEPDEYSPASVDELLQALKADVTTYPAEKPNIIFVQLESFFDPNRLEGVTFSKDPTPVFNELKEKCGSAFVTVPSIGAGTANTEFEVITEMSLDYFGTGEYPYESILQSSTCETMAYDMRSVGYTATAIHNHNATFYDRNTVYAKLGFDNFVSSEYMDGLEYNALGWEKDSILTAEIMDALHTSDTRDYIYAISVQAHGKYQSEMPEGSPAIGVYGLGEGVNPIPYEYYAGQLNETDAFIGDLIYELTKYDEPVVLVLFGDHMPSLISDETALTTGDAFQTEYVVWSNYGLEVKPQDLDAYQLSAYVQQLTGFNNGLLTKLHQSYSDNAGYQEALELLEYDTLYGDLEAYRGVNPYHETDLHMGLHDAYITSAERVGDSLRVKGKNFTTASIIVINGERVKTSYVDSDTLLTVDEIPETSAAITVIQADGSDELSSTGVWVMRG